MRRSRQFKYLVWIGLLIAEQAFAQLPCSVPNNAFGKGEEISYTISYNWGPIWVDCGKVKFRTDKESYKGSEVWHLKVTGITYPGYDAFFKVRDYYDSWVSPENFRPIDFRRYIYEGGYTLLNTLSFLPGSHAVVANTKRETHPVTTDTLHPGPCTFDMLTSVYYVRTLDLGKLPRGVNYPVKVVIDDTLFTVTFRVEGEEKVKDREGHVYDCLRIATHMVSGTVFKGGEDVMVWLTNDENKIPIYVEAKILVGSVKAYIKEYKGLLRPPARK